MQDDLFRLFRAYLQSILTKWHDSDLTGPAPIAAMFFQGTLGSFMAYSQIGGSGGGTALGPQGQPPGGRGLICHQGRLLRTK
jgi:hypothetical protein